MMPRGMTIQQIFAACPCPTYTEMRLESLRSFYVTDTGGYGYVHQDNAFGPQVSDRLEVLGVSASGTLLVSNASNLKRDVQKARRRELAAIRRRSPGDFIKEVETMPRGMTVQQIFAACPCPTYTEMRLESLRREVCGRRKIVTFADVCKSRIPIVDKVWLLLRPEYISERELHEISIWCWEEISLPIWERKYPNDRRPHEAVAAKKLWAAYAYSNAFGAVNAVYIDAGSVYADAKAAACATDGAAWEKIYLHISEVT